MAPPAGDGESSVAVDGEAVRRLRRERLLTQEQLAEATGLTIRSIKSVEKSGGLRKAATLRALAEALGVSPSVLRAETAPGDIVGRARELARVQELLVETVAGKGRVLLVAGEAGAGKTTLVEHLAGRAAARGARAHLGRCCDDDGAAPYRAWLQMLRAPFAEVDPGELERTLGAGCRDLARFRDDHAVDPRSSSAPARHRLFEAVAGFWKLCASRAPRVLVVDDLHAADRSTLLLWQFVAEEIREYPILLVGTYRHTEVEESHPLARVVHRLDHVPGYDRIELWGLGVDDVATLAAAHLPGIIEPGFAQALHARTQGNPFFVRELLRHVEPAARYSAADVPVDLPPRVHDAVRARVTNLGADVRRILESAAVLGPSFSLETVREVARLDGAPLTRGMERAVSAGVLREAVHSYEFTHAIFRDALYGQILPIDKCRLHRRAADVLEASGGPDAVASALAHHWVRAGAAGDPKRAYDHLIRAAAEADRRFAYDEAADYLLNASVLAPRAVQATPEDVCELLLDRAHALDRAGDVPAASAAFHEVATRARLAGSATLLARAALGVGLRFGQITEFGHFDPAQSSLLEEALEVLPAAPSAERAQVLSRLSTALYWSGQPARSVTIAEEAVRVAREVGDPATLVMALVALYMSRLQIETPAGRREVLDEAAAQLTGGAYPELDLTVETLRSVEWMDAADGSESYEKALVQHRMKAERLGQAQGRWWASAFATGVAFAQGRMGEAIEGMERTREIGTRSQNTNVENAYIAHTLLRHFHERDWNVDLWARWATERATMTQEWRVFHAYGLAQVGDRDQALFHLRALARDDFAPVRRPGLWAPNAAELAEVCALLGQREEGRRLHALLLPHATRNAVMGLGIGCLGPIARYLGLLDLLLDRHTDAERHLRYALERSRRLAADAWTALIELDLACLYTRIGAHALATAHREEAARCATAVGLEALAVEARRGTSFS